MVKNLSDNLDRIVIHLCSLNKEWRIFSMHYLNLNLFHILYNLANYISFLFAGYVYSTDDHSKDYMKALLMYNTFNASGKIIIFSIYKLYFTLLILWSSPDVHSKEVGFRLGLLVL